MAEIKAGFNSLEFYLAGAALVAKLIWKDFPDEAFVAIGAYVVARQTQKGFGLFDESTQKPSWKTSEFWITLGFAGLKSIFPDMPTESTAMVLGWIGMRTGVKGLAVYKNNKKEGSNG